MDSKIHQFATSAGIFFFLSGVAIGGRDYLVNAQKPPVASISPIIPKAGEFKSTQLKDGSKWALIKVWGYKYDPNFRPGVDLAVIKEAIATREFSGFILEDDSIPPVWGWTLIRDTATSQYRLEPITDQTVRNNQELFDKFRENKTRK